MSTSTFETESESGRRHARNQNHALDEVNEGLFWVVRRLSEIEKEIIQVQDRTERFLMREPIGIP